MNRNHSSVTRGAELHRSPHGVVILRSDKLTETKFRVASERLLLSDHELLLIGHLCRESTIV